MTFDGFDAEPSNVEQIDGERKSDEIEAMDQNEDDPRISEPCPASASIC
jgi:hypothetical protein